MDLLKKYGSKELTRMTLRSLKERENKRKRDVNYYIADRIRANYSRMNDSRKKVSVW